jgi:hypothetical protein
VWNHYEVPVEPIGRDWKTRVRCIECQSGFVYSGSTSSLRRHLEFTHPERFQDVKQVDHELPEFTGLDPTVEEQPIEAQQVLFLILDVSKLF